MIEFDPSKSASNLAKHGVSLEAANQFDWDTAIATVDDREDYGELRETALGFIGATLHQVVFTERNGVIRVISLRKATNGERRYYAQNI
jgi:hypothetical protein